MTKNIRKYLKKFNTKCIIMASLRKGTKKMKQKLHKILKIDDLKDMLDKSGKIYGDNKNYWDWPSGTNLNYNIKTI